VLVAEVVGRKQAADVLAGLKVVDLVCGEEVSGQRGGVDEEENAGDADRDGEDALKDKDLDTRVGSANLRWY